MNRQKEVTKKRLMKYILNFKNLNQVNVRKVQISTDYRLAIDTLRQ